MLLFPDLYVPAAYEALKIWGIDVVPSLFPYMIFSRLLAAQLRTTRIPPAYTAAFLGLLGGSPSGAAVLSVYGSSLSARSLLSLSALTGTISPTFLLNTVNHWVHHTRFTRLLLICHLFSAISTATLSYAFIYAHPNRIHQLKDAFIGNTPPESPIQQSISATLNIGGCIIMCSVVSVFVCKNPLFSSRPHLSACIHALIEMSGGIHALSLLPNTPLRAYLIAAVSGFSGFSMLIQNAYFLRPLGIGMSHQIVFALLRASLSVLAMAVCLRLF